jgi:hypothetical protein
MWGLARLGFRVPAFEFQEHGPEQQVIRDASNEGSFGDRAHEARRVASLLGISKSTGLSRSHSGRGESTRFLKR